MITTNTFSQANPNGATLTVTDLSGNYVYYEYNFNATGGFISESGLGAPLNVPLRIKLSSGSGITTPTFDAGDLHGNCDTYQIGSMNSTNTEFITTLNSCCPSAAQIRLSNGLINAIYIECASTGNTDCITYNISTTDCVELYCISFYIPFNIIKCRTRDYTVVINFSDGTSTTIIVNFASNIDVFCYEKPIVGIASSNFSNCNCDTNGGPQLRQSSNFKKAQIEEMDEQIDVYPNPTNSIIGFSGKNIDDYRISIFDINGKRIIDNLKIDKEISLNEYENGIYIYIIEKENGFRKEGKIIKQ